MISGFININKEKGMTSSRVVGKVKGILRAAGVEFGKVGHMGTLDPDGEGVLPIAIGRATRLFDYFGDKTKVYYTEFVFGVTTDTLDASGKITEVSQKIPTFEEIGSVIASLTGEIDQFPPMYSAKSVGGKRAYDLAREGVEFELNPKRVRIDKIELLEQIEENVFSFRVTCGGGTYIRSIARDMAEALGTVGHMRYIRREQSGCFLIENAFTLEELAKNPENKIMPIEATLNDFPRYDCPQSATKLVLNGVPLKLAGMPQGIFKIYCNGELVGIAENVAGAVNIRTRLN